MTLLFLLVVLSCYLAIRLIGPWGVSIDYYAIYATWNSNSYTWHLYTNNYSPVSNSIGSNFAELTNSGYAAATTNATEWTLTNEGTYYQATHADLVFTWSGSATLYGYYVLDGSGNFVGGERFTSAPYNYGSGSNTLTISPKVTCGP